MTGKSIGSYEILERIGAGGMGEVYRARDARLRRDVALKVLPPEASVSPERRARFDREARSLAALHHPGIVTVFSIEHTEDSTFLTMELVEGETLAGRIARDRLSLGEFLDMGVSLADALATAHERGVVHRDLKPENIMVTPDGQPKILDFGLAKLVEPSLPRDATLPVEASLTRPGTTMGTPAYMAPEQIEGGEVDQRADVFALGLILFEAATGRRAFSGRTVPALVSSILRDAPPSISEFRPDWPKDLSRIVGRCLEKDPKRRFQTARDVHNELRDLRREMQRRQMSAESGSARAHSQGTAKRPRSRVLWIGAFAFGTLAVLLVLVILNWSRLGGGGHGAPDEAGRVMIAVLPFENLGGAEDAYFAAGMTEEVTSRLSGVEGLGVISRTSAAQYEGSSKPLREIGRELGVDYVLEGTVRWAPGPEGHDRVRITPELVRVADDTQLWTDRYDGVLKDIFAVQSNIARSVVSELGVALLGSGVESIEHEPTENLAAYQAYLRSADAESHYDAIALLERAVELDPSFAEAWARLANQHAYLYRWGGEKTPFRLACADSTLERALALAPDDPEVLYGAGYTYYFAHNDYDRAAAVFRRLLDHNPSSARAYEGIGYVQRRQGRLEEAVSSLQMANRLDPRDSNIVYNLARTREARREFAAADSLYQRAILLGPDDCSYYDMWGLLALVRWGDREEARRRAAQCPADKPSFYAVAIEWIGGNPEGALTVSERLMRDLPDSNAMRGALLAIQAWEWQDLGNLPRARAVAGEARAILLPTVVEADQGTWSPYLSLLALSSLVLGDHDAARTWAEKAVDASDSDRFVGPIALEFLAMVKAHSGDAAGAVQILDRLLTMEYERPLTVPMLRIDEWFEPLHGEPAFEELLSRHAGQT